MRKYAAKFLMAMAVVLAVFVGKGSEAKAYEVVGGKNYITWDEYEEAERKGTLPEQYSIDVASGRDDKAKALMYNMNEYVPRAYFDYDWYLQKHPELVDICGTDKDAIYDYYANTGQANGWHGRIAPDKLISFSQFDYERYAAENPDVAAIFGQDAAALYNHYINNGIKEGRKGYATDAMTNALVRMYEVSAQIVNDDMSDREKVKAVHDWMCMNIAYDYDNYKNGTDKIPLSSFEVTGAMNRGVAVCEGYAKTFKVFMNILGIECETVTGHVSGAQEPHDWNKVKLDGEYYYIDVTWDDPVPDKPGIVYWYNYFLSKDSTFGGDHQPFDDEVVYWFED